MQSTLYVEDHQFAVRHQASRRNYLILVFKRANCKGAVGEIRGVPAPPAFCNMRLKDAQHPASKMLSVVMVGGTKRQMEYSSADQNC